MINVDKHQAWFMSLLGISFLLGWRLLCGIFALSWQSDVYSQILLVLPVSIVMVLMECKRSRYVPDWSFCAGPLMLGGAAVLAYGARFWLLSFSEDERLSIRTVALVLSWIGITVTCFGLRACGRVLFPLLFLFALVPLPKIALDEVIAFLQSGSTWSAHMLFAIAGVPVTQQGNQLSVPGLIVTVAQECSSIRSTSMLILTTLVMVHVLLHSFWRRAFIVALAIPLSVARNGLRIFTISMLGMRVDPEYFTGKLHRQGGILFFMAALCVIIGMLWWLRRGERLA